MRSDGVHGGRPVHIRLVERLRRAGRRAADRRLRCVRAGRFGRGVVVVGTQEVDKARPLFAARYGDGPPVELVDEAPA